MKTVSNPTDSAQVLHAIARLEAQGVRYVSAHDCSKPPAYNKDETRPCVLKCITIRRTPQPRIREVLVNGEIAGRIVNVRPLVWMASTRRTETFFSQTDAALAIWLDVQP